MYLSKEEERILDGEEGEARRLAMKLVVRVGEALGAERLVAISHAHASGISYDNIGDAGLEFLETMARNGGKAKVFATFNPVGMCMELEPPLKLREEPGFVTKQLRIVKLLESMGFIHSITCIPYRIRSPRLGEHLAWGESSAVAVANTLYGARTNREGGPLALAAALVGRTYYWGLHLDENRHPTIRVVVRGAKVSDELRAGLIGYYIGLELSDHIPLVEAELAKERHVISMCAAAAASGNIAMCLVKNFSPEYRPMNNLDKVEIDEKELAALRESVETAGLDEAELFFTGCPHHDASFVTKVAEYIASKNIGRLRREVWIAIPGYQASKVRDLAKKLREKNIFILPGTCIVVSRLRGRAEAIATDSLKTAFYMPRRHGIRVALSTVWQYIDKFSG